MSDEYAYLDEDDDRDCLWDADPFDLVEVMWERMLLLLEKEEPLTWREKIALERAAEAVVYLRDGLEEWGFYAPPEEPKAVVEEEIELVELV